MPLVMMCGLPCSGKTRRAQQIAAHLSTVPEAQRMPIHVVNEESLNIQRDLAYKDSVSERMARGALKSAVERLLSADSILICDSMNYIKGFRYELFARARALNTQSCVVPFIVLFNLFSLTFSLQCIRSGVLRYQSGCMSYLQ
jgi:protein KTI12